jgi:poly [ADP-ribose] polymerase
MAIVKIAKYISTEVDANKNRFWYGTLNGDGTVKVEWGRVGNASQSKVHSFGNQNAAESFFDKKCREKEGPRKGYRKLNVIDNDLQVAASSGKSTKAVDKLAKEQIAAEDPEAKKLVERLVKWNVHAITSQTAIKYNADSGLFSTPLGIVTQGAIDDARDLLIKMKPFVGGKKFRDKGYTRLLNDYLMLIPQDVGRKLDPERLYPDVKAISTQGDILDSLEASLTAVKKDPKKSPTTTTQEKVFDVKLSLCEDDQEIKRIKKKFLDTADDRHACAASYKLKKVYELRIGPVANAFEEQGKKYGNVQELWHGTNSANLLSILSKGLLIPKNYINGWAFGAGVYFANRSTKSLNYSTGHWDGSTGNSTCFMFLANVALGKPHVPKSSNSRLHEHGYDSVWAKAGVTGYLANDELIVFRTEQCDLVRLIEFEEL